MLSLPASVKIFLYSVPTDMRRGFDGLARLASDVVGQDPLAGHLFVFRNRRGDRIKILYWDRDGYVVWAKRLEAGTFRFPNPSADSVVVTPTELAMILGGVELTGVRRQRRYVAPSLTID